MVKTTYRLASMLSLLRLSYIFLPYISKFILFLLLDRDFYVFWKKPIVQIIRLFGDGLNFLVVSILLHRLANSHENIIPDLIVIALIGSEGIRLLAEKGQTIFSTLWQIIPHRRAAHWIDRTFLQRSMKQYADYYRASDEDRLEIITRLLRSNVVAEKRLVYFGGFEIVDSNHLLRGGDVRNPADGKIYIHQSWTADPYLLIGMALRRTPWIFDPRYLPHPFFYRTQANPLTTRFVFRYARYSPPFAWYQFGHEIKAARFTLFFSAMHRIGWRIEQPVGIDGTYEFDPLLHWIERQCFPERASAKLPALMTEQAVIKEILTQEKVPPADVIANTYQYPLLYVEEVLLPHLQVTQARPSEIAAATRSGTSQCG